MDGGSWHCTGDRNQDNPQEKEMQKTNKQTNKQKMAVVLQRAVKRRDTKSKGEKEKYAH